MLARRCRTSGVTGAATAAPPSPAGTERADAAHAGQVALVVEVHWVDMHCVKVFMRRAEGPSTWPADPPSLTQIYRDHRDSPGSRQCGSRG
jgi:hypothetical protein